VTAAGKRAPVAAVLFLSLFAAQASVISLSPVLSRVAADLEVSTATAGQLRTLLGLAAGVTALLVPRAARRLSLRSLMLAGTSLIAAGSLASAAAPGLAALAAAQVVIGIGVASVVAAGTAAAAAWVAPEHRTDVLSWALVGQPAAWIVGMPLLGALGELSWRLGWIALPFAASLVAATLLARRSSGAPEPASETALRAALADPAIRRWAIAELFANCGWAGTLVYAGALFTESYGASGGLTGIVLAVGAVAFVGGNRTARRLAGRDARRELVALALVLAVAIPLFGAVRVGVAASTLLFALAAFAAGGRTLIGNAFGLEIAPDRRVAIMGTRAAATQFGYFIGSGIAGLALSLWGYPGLGMALGAFFALAAAALAETPAVKAGRLGPARLAAASSASSRSAGS
jgi:DHA1 family inner membrane transport protein